MKRGREKGRNVYKKRKNGEEKKKRGSKKVK
jgi:hypothetical protein